MADIATVHLLDVGGADYGDCVVCLFGDDTVLIDGGHPGNFNPLKGHKALPDQIAAVLGQNAKKLHVSLLVVSHAHEDHIGCLPRMVKEGILTADFALVADPDRGWGRTPDDARPDAGLDRRSRQLVMALREEVRSPFLPDDELTQFLADAVDMEPPYREMLDKLKDNGTKVVRHGRDSHVQLLKRFQKIGFDILGPVKKHLEKCAARVVKGMQDAAEFVADMTRDDAVSSAVDAYRRMMTSGVDAGVPRFGNYVNLQSSVLTFEVGEKRFFFAGDFQFQDPQSDEPIIIAERDRLNQAIAASSPYAFYKLCHHGSNNGFEASILADLKNTKFFGVCGGSESHPGKKTLALLEKNKSQLTWARTDHNRHCTFHVGQTMKVDVETGSLNDPKPNPPQKKDTLEQVPPGAPPAAPPEVEPRIERSDDDDRVEVVARVPHVRTRVTITIDVDPAPSTDRGGESKPIRSATPASVEHAFTVSPAVSGLLVATNARKLADNIGDDIAEEVITGLRAAGALVIGDLPADADAAVAAAPVQAELKRNSRIKGVVLLGGYDVVAAQSLDALPPSLRKRVGSTGDPDDFVVWSDEIYGDTNGDLLSEVPISRVPDGRSADLVLAALSAKSGGGSKSPFGMRNIERPFADLVYVRLDSNGKMLTSEPSEFDNTGLAIDGDYAYVMLHGDYTDGSRYWGEQTPNDREALNIGNIPKRGPAVVFTGCCWGALTVDRPAGRFAPGQTLTPKRPENSIALTFLQNGALAFVGCTGAHYSPREEPFNYFGAPMHQAFWDRVLKGSNPATALFEAKKEYMSGMPHGQTKPSSAAIEFKIWRQYTCLGLGW